MVANRAPGAPPPPLMVLVSTDTDVVWHVVRQVVVVCGGDDAQVRAALKHVLVYNGQWRVVGDLVDDLLESFTECKPVDIYIAALLMGCDTVYQFERGVGFVTAMRLLGEKRRRRSASPRLNDAGEILVLLEQLGVNMHDKQTFVDSLRLHESAVAEVEHVVPGVWTWLHAVRQWPCAPASRVPLPENWMSRNVSIAECCDQLARHQPLINPLLRRIGVRPLAAIVRHHRNVASRAAAPPPRRGVVVHNSANPLVAALKGSVSADFANSFRAKLAAKEAKAGARAEAGGARRIAEPLVADRIDHVELRGERVNDIDLDPLTRRRDRSAALKAAERPCGPALQYDVTITTTSRGNGGNRFNPTILSVRGPSGCGLGLLRLRCVSVQGRVSRALKASRATPTR